MTELAMNIVDPRKLDMHREVVDSVIAEQSIQYSIGRRYFLEKAALDFGYVLEFFKIDNWYVCTAQHVNSLKEIQLYQNNDDWFRGCELDVESRFERRAAAACMDDAAIALVLGLLNDDADIFISSEDFDRYYPGDMAEFSKRIWWCLEWYLRVDVWFQDCPQVVSASEIDSVMPLTFT
jgi:hypothetical protein